MSAPMTAVVPYRADTSGVRAQNAMTVLRWLDDLGAAVILVEHGTEPDAQLLVPSGTVRLHIPSAGAFNKAAACNAGIVQAATPVIALVDADTLTYDDILLACTRRVHRTGEVIRPFGRLIELDEGGSAGVRESGELPWVADAEPDDGRGEE